MNFKRRSFFMFALAFLFVICSAELLARFYLGLGTPPLYMQHSKIEYMLKPNQSVKRFGNRIEVNEYGMRSSSFATAKPEDEFRILVFGDSVINGGNLTDQDKLATSVLQNKLTRLTNKNITVLNVSAGSWGPGNWLAYSQEFGFFGADLVIVVTSSHDYIDNPTYQPLNENTHPTKTPAFALFEGVNRYLPRYFSWLANDSQEQTKTYRFKNQVDIKEVEKGLDDLKQFLINARLSAPRIYVFQYLEKTELRGYYPGYLEIKGLCEKLSIPVLSFESYFTALLSNHINPYSDYIHPNDIGHAAIAEAFIDLVMNNYNW